MGRSLDDRSLAALRRVAVELGQQEGRGISRAAIVELAGAAGDYALEIYGGDPTLALARPARASVFAALTAREREVAALVARGYANSEIAAALFISKGTVKDHVHSILRKSGLKSRAAVAGMWTRS
jgi:DNA-binding NarL/FixJ family response regulator